MENNDLSKKLSPINSKTPLEGKEREKAMNRLDELCIEMGARDIRINMLNKLFQEEDKYLQVDILKEDYNQILDEFSQIYDLISKSCLNKIKFLIKTEKKISPKSYLPKVKEKIMIREDKIREFFTLGKYINRRMYNLEGDCIKFIKNMAIQNEAYEFLEDLEGKQDGY